MIKEGNSRILQHNCVKCHEDMVFEMFKQDIRNPDAVSCMHCHAGVGHGELPTGIGGPERSEELKRSNHEQVKQVRHRQDSVYNHHNRSGCRRRGCYSTAG